METNDWRSGYARRLIVTDLIALSWAVLGAQLIWFGFDVRAVDGGAAASFLALSYTTVSVLIVLSWVLALQYFGSRDARVIGTEFTEYKLVVVASLWTFALLAIAAYLLKMDLARGYFFTALPLGVLVLLISRWMWRQWLRLQRSSGRFSYRLLLVGSASSTVHLARELLSRPEAGYHVVGVCIPDEQPTPALLEFDVPVWTGLDDLVGKLEESGGDTVAITGSDQLSPSRVRELSWSLEPGRKHLIVAPSLTDIAGPRIHTRPVAGLPLIHVETPRYEGAKHRSKRAFDLVGSAILLLLLLPVFLVVAALVKASSRGPVFYRQERIGLNGEAFRMYKFRSMRPNADQELAALLQAQGTSETPLFKVQNDPRITPVGRVLRKYSIDELPQLINVLKGDMSLVGPRPQIAGEVALYTSAATRRLLLKPGVSGLWQVSGRSSLSWEDAIRLDLYYVENWSITGDILILFRTARAVLMPGADAQ
ncbi:sugar transferase [Lysobacter korlensis]|uniref:Sugar transferase n=1 Tax=Lysobacter korlensis TaxID=553636 RepID=A0ABV6RZU4_9GAMM